MSATPTDTISPIGPPAPLVRFFGWTMLSVLAAFLINNILIVWMGFPPLSALFTGGDGRVWVVAGLYVLAVIGAGAWVARNGNASLRYEARKIGAFNAYLIRACFFAVLFVGIADGIVSFMRVESLLGRFLSDETVLNMIRAQYIATWVHLPSIILGFVLALFTRTLGFHWLALLIVIAELLIVFSRFIFSYEQALMGDLVRYWYAALFLFASAYTLLEEGHVRVDVFYAGFSPRGKGKVNTVGTILLGITTCWCIIVIGMGSAQSIINSPVKNFEVSQTGTSGAYTKYQMAAFLGIFAVTMLIQFVSYYFEAVADARGERGHKDHDAVVT
ncbi:MAG: TRAP transporter small permease subunit [Paracoccaceae bacterium]